MTTDDPTSQWSAPGSGTSGNDGPGFFKRTWRRFRSWPLWVQILVALVVVAAIGGAGASGSNDAEEPPPDVAVEPVVDNDADDDPAVAPTSTTAKATTTTVRVVTTTTVPPTTTTTLPPQPKIYDGRGDTVLPIEKPEPGEPAIVQFSHDGGSNFAVWSLDANLTQIDLLVNTIGGYNGRRPIDFDADATRSLEITADGNWHIEVLPLDAARAFSDRIDGTGDDVVFFTGDAGIAALSHGGDSNFAIWAYSQDDTDLLVNEIGGYTGNVPLRSPPAILDVTANGPWSIAVS